MKKRMVTSVAVALMLAGGSAFAQQAGDQPSGMQQDQQATGAQPSEQPSDMQQQAAAQNVITSERLLEMNVQGSEGQDIGGIDELVIDRESGEVQGVVVSVGGFLGIGDKKVMLPWDQVQMTEQGITTQQTKEQLEQAQAWQDPDQQTAERPGQPTTTPPGATPGTAPGAGSPPPATSGTAR